MAERTPKAPGPPLADYTPPQPAFLPCPRCQQTVLRASTGELVTPLKGMAHVCPGEEC